jgi:hypothetical protein
MTFIDNFDGVRPINIAHVSGSLMAPIRLEFTTFGGNVSIGFRTTEAARRFASDIHAALVGAEAKAATEAAS